MYNYTTENGNGYWVDGVFAFIEIGGDRLTCWESSEELERWVDGKIADKTIATK